MNGRPVSEPLPELLDCRALQTELGVKRATAEAVMRHLPIVQLPELRKTFVRRDDVAALLDRFTFTKDDVPA